MVIRAVFSSRLHWRTGRYWAPAHSRRRLPRRNRKGDVEFTPKGCQESSTPFQSAVLGFRYIPGVRKNRAAWLVSSTPPARANLLHRQAAYSRRFQFRLSFHELDNQPSADYTGKSAIRDYRQLIHVVARHQLQSLNQRRIG